MADAAPETKAAHFAAARTAVAAQATAAVGSFLEADEETQNATVGDVLVTYNTLDADVDNSVSLGSLYDAMLGRGTRGRRRRLGSIWGRRLQDEATADVDVSACVGGSPDLEDLNWSGNGAVSIQGSHSARTLVIALVLPSHCRSRVHRVWCRSFSCSL